MITVLTAAYNRAELLKNLYRSLCRQTCGDFEWLVVDDGSNDETASVTEGFVSQNKLSIRYFRKENGGKHTAINMGVSAAKGEYIFIVDSDDTLIPDAIEKICTWTASIDKDKRFAGVAGCRAYPDGKLIGAFPKGKGYVDATNLQRRRSNLFGDKAEVYRTGLLRKYPFPAFEGERFLSEAVVWDRIAEDGYVLRWFPDKIYITSYLPDGLSQNVNAARLNSFRGWTLYTAQSLKNRGGLERCTLIGVYYKLAKERSMTCAQICQALSISRGALSAGLLLYAAKEFIKKTVPGRQSV